MVNRARRKAEGGEGAGVKVKKVRTAPTNTSLLPPCKVCGEAAAGFHYGANTCEACKGFFRRTLVRGRGYRCVNGDEKCDVMQVGKTEKSKICCQCRHLKCLAVGMSTEAIKTGRYTHAKRTQDILEYKQVMGGGDGPSHPSNAAPTVPTSITPVTTAEIFSSATPITTAPSVTHVTTAVHSLATTAMPSSITAALPLFSTSVTMAAPSFDTSVTTGVPSCDNAQAAQYSTLTSVSSGFISHSSEGSSSVHIFNQHSSRMVFPASVTHSPVSFKGFDSSPESMGFLLTETNGAGPSSVTVSPGSQGSPSAARIAPSSTAAFSGSDATPTFVRNMGLFRALGGDAGCCEDAATRDPGVLTAGSTLPSDLGVLTPVSSLSSPGGGALSQGEGGEMSGEECQQLVEQLLQSHSVVHSCKYTLTPEQMLKKQQSCFEKCQAQMEAFGALGQVSEEEYQDIYRATGIDVDNRQIVLNQLAQLMDKNIREHITFVKTIPGFSSLSVADQIRLIKDNRCEASLIFQSDGYNEELCVITMPSGGTFCHHQMEKLCGRERREVRCRSLKVVKKLGLSYNEKVLLKCMILFTQGHDDVDDPETVSAIQWRIAQSLLWLLKENGRPHPTRFFSRIISTLCLVKELTTVFYDWIKREPFSHYACFKNNKLLAEWFSSS